ncbi:TPA_asm: hypothetical protein GZU98_13490 [Listeria monocytogenes]|nr:hypothetical protein [Listeria monocytogenes]HAC4841736.1 hypothetical protein [Listeria monocytogenes]HAC4844721.1 hypothetical protein [Listeria monocytogenes]HAC4850639.1 hypothetical protein [Listeria monocytogenes]
MEKKRKVVIGVSILTGLLILGVGMLGFHHYSVKAAEEEKQEKIITMQKKLKAAIQKNQTTVDGFYTNAKKEDIKTDLKQDAIDQMNKQIKTFEGKELPSDTGAKLNTLIMDNAYAGNMLAIRNQAEKLLDQQGALVTNADITSVENQLKELKDIKPIFIAQQTKVVENAKNQANEIKTATAKVNQLFTSDKKTEVKQAVTRDAYNRAKDAVSKIKQKQAKDALTKNLASVNKYLSDQEKKAQQAAAKQQTVQNETNNESENNDSNGNNSNNDSNSNTTGGNNGSTNSPSNGSSSSSSSGSKASGGGNSSSAKSSSGSKSSGGSSSSKSSGGKSSGSTSKDVPGKTWNGTKENKGTMKSDEGRTWGTIEW